MAIKKQLKQAVELLDRGLDKNIRVCVTGLSGSGKTAFITSLINQLLHQKKAQLPFWLAHAEARILGVKQVTYSDLHIPEFPYKEAISALETHQWPQSTTNISQSRISIKYEVKNKWLKRVQPHSHLNIDIIDYPGEWLLDLPLLDLNFYTWSKQFCEWADKKPQSKLADEWYQSINSLLKATSSESDIKLLAKEFRQFLVRCKESSEGIHFIQPGRFVLPGDLDGAPVLDFFPVPRNLILSDELTEKLEQRFNYYRDNIVRPFFKEYFSSVDRQLLLVDVLKVLNHGYDSYRELQQTLSKLITSFDYGQTNWLKRMFQPKINKLIIASSKSDQVPPEQHNAMKSFLSNMLIDAENQVGYQGIDVATVVFSAIQVTEPVLAEHENKKLACVKGVELENNKEVINYPGKIPSEPMSKKQWSEQRYNFIDYAIPDLATHKQLPHHRMDRVIELLIGDKFL